MTDPEPMQPDLTPQEPAPEPTPTPEPEPSYPKWMDDAGFSADLKASKLLGRYKTAEEQAKAHIELRKTLGGDAVLFPKDGADPGEWDAIHKRMGWPESTDGYGLGEWQPPEGLPWNGEISTKMVEAMHELRLSKDQAQGVLNRYAEMEAEAWDGLKAESERQENAGVESLRSEWGAAYEPKFDAAKRAAKTFFPQTGTDENGEPRWAFDDMTVDGMVPLGSHPDFIRAMAAIGELMGEDKTLGPRQSRATRTPEEAITKLMELQSDAEKMKILEDQGHPLHKATYEYMTALQREAYGDET